MKGQRVKLASNEPVAVASGVTVIAGTIVAVGQWTHLYTMTADEAVAIVGGVFATVSAVSAWWARRRVTPTAKVLPAGTPHTPNA